MEWSSEQQLVIKQVNNWLKDPSSQLFRLFGYAGTGKTTLAKHLADNADGRVIFAAYTGKAAHVLQKKGCKEASTIHSYIYIPKNKSKRRLNEYREELIKLNSKDKPSDSDLHQIQELRIAIKKEEENLERPMFSLFEDSPVKSASLVVIDECSMVDERMALDLLSFGTKVLVLGDPAQLPPVKSAGYFTNHTPDAMLTEIHRQAKDNPILKLATDVRQGRSLKLGQYGESKIITKKQLDLQEVLQADQLLVGRNRTRKGTNTRMRGLLGYNGDLPVTDDRVVCLRNNHELGLLNGAVWKVREVVDVDDEKILFTIISEDDRIETVETHDHYFLNNEENLRFWQRRDAEEFDYAYALTVHKSQGSQWDNVMLFDESGCFNNTSRQWLYTGITRAAEKLTIVQV